MSVILILVFAAIALYVWNAKAYEFRIQQYGISQKNAFGENGFLYTETAKLTYAASAVYVNGVYTGTTYTFTFFPDTHTGKKDLTYTCHMKEMDEELENLRGHVSRVVAGKMAQQFSEENPVQWTDSLRFLPEGLEYTASGWFSKKPPQIIRYQDISSYGIHEGYLHLWLEGAENSSIQETVQKENFFPGYELLVMLLSPDDEAPPETDDGSEEVPGEE